MKWSWEAAHAALPSVGQGFAVTVWAVFGGALLALALGLGLAALQWIAAPRVAKAAMLTASLVRNTPLLVQLYFLYYFVLPVIGLSCSALTTGTLALGVHYATYTAEVYRAGIESVPRTQWDAAVVLRLTRRQALRYVVLPQAIPPMMPALGNYVIAMLKDAPLLSAISVSEVLTRALEHGARQFRYLEAVTLVGALYLVVSVIASALVGRLEARVAQRQGVAYAAT